MKTKMPKMLPILVVLTLVGLSIEQGDQKSSMLEIFLAKISGKPSGAMEGKLQFFKTITQILNKLN